jgi:hypothetical protein
MADYNVLQTDTFEEWRLKSNALGSLVGDLSNLSTTETNVVDAVNQLRTDSDSINTYIGNRTIPGTDTTLTDSLATLRSNIDTNDDELADHETRVQTIENLAGIGEASGLQTTASNIIDAVNENKGRIDDHQNEIGGDIATDYDGYGATYGTSIIGALNAFYQSETNADSNYLRRDGTGSMDSGAAVEISNGGINSQSSNMLLKTAGSTRITVSSSNGNVGIGKSPGSYKVDISGGLNATSLYYGGQDTDSRYVRAVYGEQGTVVSDDTVFQANVLFNGDIIFNDTTVQSGTVTITEWAQDVVGGMFTSNTESGGISAVYDDNTGKVTLAIANNSHSHTSGNISDFTEAVQDVVGGMVSPTNQEDGITVDYNDTTGKLSFNVNDPLLKLDGDVTGQATMSNLGDVTITTVIANNSHTHDSSTITGFTESVQDAVGSMVSGNTESGISVTYDDSANEYDFTVSAGTSNIVNGAVTADKLASNSVTQAKLADDAVGSAELKNVVSLTIYNSSGSALKTIYGAGS